MSFEPPAPLWQTAAVLAGRVIFAAIFIMGASFKFLDMNATASYIASAGLPLPLLLAWLAAIFEAVLAFCLLTGAFFSEAALLAAAYVPSLTTMLHMIAPEFKMWGIILSMSTLPLLLGPLIRLFVREYVSKG